MNNTIPTTQWLNDKSAPALTHCLNRNRIFKSLDKISEHTIAWITGPPGAGKSWAIASYIATRNINSIWYSLDSRDNDPVFFFRTLGLHINKFSPQNNPDFCALLTEIETDINNVSSLFFDLAFQSFTQPFILVFDNFHTLKPRSPLLKIMEILKNLISADGRLIIISRTPVADTFPQLQLNRSIHNIDYRELEFNTEETAELILTLGLDKLTAEKTHDLHKQFQGWVGGMVLQLQQEAGIHISLSPADNVKNFLQQELFGQLTDKQQSDLIKLALLNEIPNTFLETPGNECGAELIKQFSQQFNFIRHYSKPCSHYLFFPVFRFFLLQKFNDLYSPDEQAALHQKYADQLISLGDFEQAAFLLEKNQAYNEIEKLIIQTAPALLQQGQFPQLQKMISYIPHEHHSAWVTYWSATMTLPANPSVARQGYESALYRFEKEKNSPGIFLSWAGIVDSFIFLWDDFKPLDHWITWMEQYMEKNPGFPSAEIQARITFAMFSCLMYRQPQHPDLPVWSQRLSNMLEHLPDKNQRIAIATHYVLYLAWMGEFEQATTIIERLKPSASAAAIQPVHLIAWYQTQAMHAWLCSDFDESQTLVNAGLALADKTGIHLWDFILQSQNAYLALETCTAENWPGYLQNILNIMDENGRLHQAHYYYLAALEALRQKHYERALLHIKRSLQAVIELGTPYPEALNYLAMSRIHIELANDKEADIWLNKTAVLAQQMNSHLLNFNLLLTRAEFYFTNHDNEKGSLALSQAMAIGAEKNYLNTDWWRPDVMCNLCIKALENNPQTNIESNYVRSLIIKRNLNPSSPPLHLDNWPWKIRIYTLGRFSILQDNTPVSINGKGQNKPIELLKSLISLGGRDVSEEKISEALWPDAEGDNAHSAFTTTLSRLRKLLGRDVLLVHNGQLSLNDHYCWLDTWTFERTLNELDTILSSSEKNKKGIQQKMQAIFGLYHGAFMDRENQSSWMLAMKGRLQSKFLRSIKSLIGFYSRKCQCKQVMTLYEKALELDPLSEEYYRGLMRCQAGQGNVAEALAIYDNCLNILAATFSIAPSEKTQQLHRLIKKGDKDTLSKSCKRCAHAIK